MIPYKEQPEPQDDIVLSSWGAGNYFIEDKFYNKTIRINSELYWKIISQVRDLMATVEENI